MGLIAGSVLIFLMRLADVSIGSLRIVTLVQGRRWLAGTLGFFESLIWLLAASQVLTNLDEPLRIVAFAGGFAAGTVLGSSIDRWLAMGHVGLRIISSVDEAPVATALRAAGCGVTTVNAEGLLGEVRVTFSVIPRRRLSEITALVKQVSPGAFLTTEAVTASVMRRPSDMRK